MQFFRWTTDYDNYKRHCSKRASEPDLFEQLFGKRSRSDKPDAYDVFFKWRHHDLQRAGMVPHRIDVEDAWIKDRNPYYNVHPKLVSKLCKVDLTKIPSHLFKLPHGLRSVNIRFAEQHPEFTVNEEMRTERLPLMYDIPTDVAPSGSFLTGFLIFDSTENGNRYVTSIVEFNVKTAHDQPFYAIFRIMPRPEVSMQECIDEAKGRKRGESYEEMIRNYLRLAVTVGFLADNPTICEADVLADDRHKYQSGTDTEREVIAARARRRGKYGYNIGTDLMFVGPMAKGEPRSAEGMSGRELEWAHLRQGHPHCVRYGANKELVKIMWYVPLTVRPDLPFKAD